MNGFSTIRAGVFWVLVFVVVVVLFQSAAFACPTCKEGLAENDPHRAAMVRGYFWSIIFMMSMPFLILAGLSSYFYLEVRRARRARSPDAQQPVAQLVV